MLVYDPGGPGLSGAKRLVSLLKVDARLAEAFDIVTFERDPTSFDVAPECDAVVSQLLADGLDANPTLQTPVAVSCSGDESPTVSVVDDIARVARQEGYDSVSFLSVSYGSVTAILFAERFPELVGTLALDSPSPVGSTWKQIATDAVDTIETTVDAVTAARCRDTADTCHGVPELELLGQRLMSHTEMDRGPLQLGLLSMLRSWPQSKELLAQVLQDDSDLRLLKSIGFAQVGAIETLASTVSARLSIECADLGGPPTLIEARNYLDSLTASGRWIAAIAASQTLLCAKDSPSDSRSSVDSSRMPGIKVTRSLVVFSSADPVIPAARQRRLAEEFGSEEFVVVGAQHGHFGTDPCGTAALVSFLLNQSLPAAC